MIIPPNTHPASSGGAPQGGGSGLAASFPNCVMDLDVTQAGGVNGQLLVNLTGDTAYDHIFGSTPAVSTDDPSIVDAGLSNGYAAFGGDDFFTLAGPYPDFLARMHNTDAGRHWTLAIMGYFISTNIYPFCLGNPGNQTTEGGLYVTLGGNRVTYNHTSNTGAGVSATTGPLTSFNNAPACLILSYDANSGLVKFWVNSRTLTSQKSLNPTATTAPASDRYGIGRLIFNTSHLFLPNGNSIYAVSLFDQFFDDAAVSTLIDQYNARHGRVYA